MTGSLPDVWASAWWAGHAQMTSVANSEVIDARANAGISCMLEPLGETIVQLECALCRTIGEVDARELERAFRVAAASRIELGTMVGERQRMFLEKAVEARASGHQVERRH